MHMGNEQRGGGYGGKNGRVSDESKKNNKRRHKKVSSVQRLYDTCKDVFAECGPGIVPTPEKVEKLASLLDSMSESDVGLRPNMPFFSSERAPAITYLHIADCEQFSIGIFCLPPTSVIPLHNHPGMTVFGKLLFGTMHIKSFDWSQNAAMSPSPDDLRLAKLKVDSEFTAPCKTSVLYPNEGGNMHRFTAITACAVLDVLGPPYSDSEGRHCQYYHEFPFSSFSVEGDTRIPGEEKDGYAWLKERENPEDLCVVGAHYTGPKISKK